MLLNDSALRALARSLRADSRATDEDAPHLPGTSAIDAWHGLATDAGDDKLAGLIERNRDALIAVWDRLREDEARDAAREETAAIFDQLQVDALRDAIASAQCRWEGADWTHELELDGEDVRDAEGRVAYCEGHDECGLCLRAGSDAFLAERHGERAMTAVASGDLPSALRELCAARELERKYGDSPIWGPPAELAERIVEAGEGER